MGSRVNRKLQLIILLVLVSLVGTMSIAYAVLSTTLNINGTAQVQDASWNVHFDNVEVNPGSVTTSNTPIIIDSKTIDFSVVLNNPGEFYKFDVDIINDGSIDAMIDSIIKSPDLTSEQAKYIKYEIEYVSGESISSKQLLASNEFKTISVLIAYRSDISMTDLNITTTTLNLSIQLNYVQADNTSTEVISNPKKLSIVNGDLNTIGSEICIGEECFYLINNDGFKATMLAKHNLYVGKKCTSKTNYILYGEEATGIQDSTMTGYQGDGKYPRNVTTEYSNDSQKGTNYSDYIGSIVEKYVNNYWAHLQTLGIEVQTARLITAKELKSLGCESLNSTCKDAPSWVYSSSYWTGTPTGTESINDINSSTKSRTSNYYYSEHLFGVRPVIEISLTEF